MDKRIFGAEDGIDEEGCLLIYDNDQNFYRLVLDTFQKEITKTVKDMAAAFSAGDIEGYRILVHGLKGSGGSVGAKALVEMATISNELIKEGKWDEAAVYHEPILNELERLIRMIPERLS